jgi:hypothetical protein
MDSTPALHWLGIDQWTLRVPWPDHLVVQEPQSEVDDVVPMAPVEERHNVTADSPTVADTDVSEQVPIPVSNGDLCFVSANGQEFSALVSAISRCLPSGKTVVHQPAGEEQLPSVHWNGKTWSLAELRRSGRAKRVLWRLLVGSKA